MSELQFEKAEPETQAPLPSASACVACKEPLTDTYYEANGQNICSRCREALNQPRQHSMAGAIGFSFLRGGVVALVCAAIDAAIAHFAHISLGLAWIFWGIFIGGAVQNASEGRGGWVFKLIAMVITYFAVGASLLFQALTDPQWDVPLASLGGVLLSLFVLVAGPVIDCMNGPLSIIIYGIGFYNAWHAVQKVQINVTGPYQLKPAEQPLEPEQPQSAPLP
jgi:hypothetical protein